MKRIVMLATATSHTGWRMLGAILLAPILLCGSIKGQKSTSATSTETPEHFIKGVLRIATASRGGIEILDGSESVYSPGFLDAMFGKGCFTAHRPCLMDHLMWARICGCRYFPEDVQKKGDPLCGCPARPKFSELLVTRANTRSADVSALLNLEPHGKDRITWHLILTPEGWRIDDVATSDIRSLKARMSP
jgi:hypothetical protein